MVINFTFNFELLDKHLFERQEISRPKKLIAPLPKLSKSVADVVVGGGIHWWSSLIRPLGVKGTVVWPKDTNFFYSEAEKQFAVCRDYQKPDLWLDPGCLVGLGMDWPYLVLIDTLAYIPNPIRTMWEWNRVLADNAKIVLMSQHPKALGEKPCTQASITKAYWCHQDFKSDTHSPKTDFLPRVRRFREYDLRMALTLVDMANIFMSSSPMDDAPTWMQGKTFPFEVIYQQEVDDSHDDCWLLILKNHKLEKLPKPKEPRILKLPEETEVPDASQAAA